MLKQLALDYQSQAFRSTRAIHADCFEWLGRIPADSLHAIVTDPPYGVKEYDFDQLEKKDNGNGGIWRIPPSFDGLRRLADGNPFADVVVSERTPKREREIANHPSITMLLKFAGISIVSKRGEPFS